MRRLTQLARWLETFWSCQCDYNNIATMRCYHCGARPSRVVRAQVELPRPMPRTSQPVDA